MKREVSTKVNTVIYVYNPSYDPVNSGRW